MAIDDQGYQGESHIFIEPNRIYLPKPKSTGGFPPSDHYINQTAPTLEKQFEETISAIESKNPYDNMAYYILNLRVSNTHPLVSDIIKIMNATILSEINENEILVTSKLDDLKTSKSVLLERKSISKHLFKIHYLQLNDIIDPELDLEYSDKKYLTFHLVPNLGYTKAKEYITQIERHLKNIDISIQNIWVDDNTGDAFIDIFLTRGQLSNLLENFGFIFKVHETMKVQSIEPKSVEIASNIQIKEIDENEIANLPKICIIDTGVNLIPQLQLLVKDRVAGQPIKSLDDFDNHGTLVASLAAYGDTIPTNPYPKARIISYKVKEDKTNANLMNSLTDAIHRFSDCRIFSCSLDFEGTKLGHRLFTKNIDTISQMTNRIIVFSAGNLNPSEIITAISHGVKYPDYINEAPVSHPSDAPCVLSVGSCTKYSRPDSLAPSDAPSPFTRFGTNLNGLGNCPKPELVEHGGNLCYTNGEFNCNNVGVTTFSNQGKVIEDIGTSFSAPLVSTQLARLWERFSNQIHNAETIKAVLLSTCKLTSNHSRYVGFGVPSEDELFFSKMGVVRVIFEGNLPLSFNATGTEVIPVDEVEVFVPSDVFEVELFLVHSDNYKLTPFPKLNSYITVRAEKPGKSGSVAPAFGNPSSQTHVKHLVYRYQRNIKGDWFFRIVPRGINIPVRERNNVTIRYGGVLKLRTKMPRFRLGDSIMRGLKRGSNVKIPLISTDVGR